MSEQVVVNFRLERQLDNAQVFAQWLVNNGLDYSTFHEQVLSSLKLAALKQKVIEPKLQQYFIERKIFLDRVALSTIVVASQELADELLKQIEEGAVFETLAREYSLTDDPIINGMLGAVSRSSLSDDIRSLVDAASPREIVGPLAIEGKWFLLRVEKFLPASLDNLQLKQALENELFDQWLAEKVQKLTIKVEIK